MDRQSLVGSLQGASPQLLAEETRFDLSAVRQALISVAYDRNSSRSMQDTFVEGLGNLLDFLPQDARVVYCSTTGVYHQQDGTWVDESSPCRPAREGGLAHLAAEELLRAANRDIVVLRLAGIYGPGRFPNVALLKAGEPIRAAKEGWLNLIHLDDIATAILAAWSHPAPEQLYVVSDGNPVLRRDYYAEVARLHNTPPPIFLEPTSNDPISRRGGSDKRINPARAHRDLLRQLKYPSYREGLRSSISRT
jgi:nucleoside-diphosphate-sugar epimerase